ncbi:L,D-transpeptidase family protein [Clostridium arbusti]|uniref:L,D-transpeptidase family protein n=1 Tax=Clostridium arbusti TaxID=1137848 RepID=UPI0002881EFE|nr:L,D-transpeptidase family protein [Clostridium arbusti]
MKVKRGLTLFIAVILSIFTVQSAQVSKAKADTAVGIDYQVHVQNIGWQNDKKDGDISGTVGKGLRVEGIKIHLTNAPAGAQIKYQAHVQKVGWQDWKADGDVAGTQGQALRLEAIKLQLVNMPGYSIEYQAHVQNIGWQGWVNDGDIAGTQGQSLRIEALRIRIVKTANIIPSVQYEAHAENVGWQSYQENGDDAGTTGHSYRVEALKVSLRNAPTGAQIKYQTHVQSIGWQDWKFNGNLAGTVGQSKRLEAIKLELVNMPGYSIKYQAHVQNIGWQPWVGDGETAGTTGQGRRMEAIRIMIVKNGSSIPAYTPTVEPTPVPDPPKPPEVPKYIVNSLNTGNSQQAVVVYTDNYGQVFGTCETFSLVNGNWTRAFSPFSIDVGYNGFASPGGKREGDGKTPEGKYSFGSMMFGKYANPGVRYSYKQLDNNDVWVDDPKSSYYNLYERKPVNGRWNSAENLLAAGDLYSYAAVINYNSARTPYLGSAIFFHQWRGPGSGTSGCVAADRSNLLQMLRWLDPGKNPIIIMGKKSNLQSF